MSDFKKQLQKIKEQISDVWESEIHSKILLEELLHLKSSLLTQLAYSQCIQNALWIEQNPLFYEIENMDPHTYKILKSVLKMFVDLENLLNLNPKEKSLLVQNLKEVQKSISQKFHVLHTYTNELLIFSNILEKKYRLEEIKKISLEDPMDYDRFYTDIENFIFYSDHLSHIEEKMKVVMDKLPLSMTKNHYYDCLKKSLLFLFRKGSEKNIINYMEILQKQFDFKELTGYGEDFEILYKEIEKIKSYTNEDLKGERLLSISTLGESLGSQLKELLSITAFGYETINKMILLFSVEDLNVKKLSASNSKLYKIHSTVSSLIKEEIDSYTLEEQLEKDLEKLHSEVENLVSHYQDSMKLFDEVSDIITQQDFKLDHHLQQLSLFEESLFYYINEDIFHHYLYNPDTENSLEKHILEKHISSFIDFIKERISTFPSFIIKEKLKSILKYIPTLFDNQTSFMEYFKSAIELSGGEAHKLAIIDELVLLMDQYGYFTEIEYPQMEDHGDHCHHHEHGEHCHH